MYCNLIKKRFAVFSFFTLLIAGQAQASEFESPSNDASENHYSYRTTQLIAGATLSSWALLSNSLESDKKRHFGISLLLGAGSELMLREYEETRYDRWKRITYATGLALIPGVIKEITDSRFDNGDLAADLAGSFLGAYMSDLIQGPIDQKLTVQLSSKENWLTWHYQF